MKFTLHRPARPVHRLLAHRLALFLGASLLCFAQPIHPAHADTQNTLKQIFDENWQIARTQVQQSGNPVLGKLYEWNLYRDNLENLSFQNIADFINRHPHWPDKNSLYRTAERNMPNDLPPTEVMAWFTKNPPVTGEGIERLIHAAKALNQQIQKPVADIINSSWPTATMDVQTQADIAGQYSNLISKNSHESRFDVLLQSESYTMARGLAGILQHGYPKLIEARIALREEKRGAYDLIYSVPKSLQSNTGLILDRIRSLRKADNDAAAIALLNKNYTAAHITFPKDWWKERNILARRMIENKNYAKAYQLASAHHLKDGSELAEAEWLSGWLALRFLNRPEIAYGHFTRMFNKVETAISKARASYWAGRSAEVLGKASESKTWYYQASSYPHTYYGQVALSHLRLKSTAQIPAVATAHDHTSVTSSDLVQAAVMLHRAGYDAISTKFIKAYLETDPTAGEYQAFATYLKKLGYTAGAYKVAKQASWENIFLGNASYPSLMKWIEPLSIDPALAHAIIRQESQFEPDAKSPAGALGLMQLMPGTAKEVAKKRGWDHKTDWLTSRPEHNILLGSAYLNDLLRRFNGSYPMAIAAYNAGPSRVNGWLETFGDPRKGEINWIDWLELIPVSETRNYVQRVTEGIVTYRDHMGFTQQ